MTDIKPRTPQRPLFWPDFVLDLQDQLLGMDGEVYIIGGAVRDAWRHWPVYDLDLATNDDAIGLARTIANSFHGDVFIMDEERDVARVLLQIPAPGQDSSPFIIDVARFRGPDLYTDLVERDFTLNAMAVNLLGDLNQLIDPLNGEADLKIRYVRRCSEHAISADPLRALRAVRISTQLGARIESQTIEDIRSADLSTISPERLRDELMKLLALEKPSTALRVAGALHLLDSVIPQITMLRERPSVASGLPTGWDQALLMLEKMMGVVTTISPRRTDSTASQFGLGMIVMALDRFRKPLQTHLQRTWANDRPHRALLALAATFYPLGTDELEALATHLRLSNDEKKQLTGMVRALPQVLALPIPPSNLDLHRFWYPANEQGIDACLLGMAHTLCVMNHELSQDDWIVFLNRIGELLHAWFNRYDEIVAPPMLVDGTQLMDALQSKPGKHIGQLLDMIREGQVSGELRTPEDAILAARSRLNGKH